MSLAAAGLYAAKWTRHIEAEWIGSVEHRLPMLVGRLGERRDAMREAVADWEVEEGAWRAVALGLVLPDAKDVHVLAAALAGHADCIVTTNLKDFPTATLAPLGIEAIHPDHFIVAQWDLEQIKTVAAFKLASRSPRHHPKISLPPWNATGSPQPLIGSAKQRLLSRGSYGHM